MFEQLTYSYWHAVVVEPLYGYATTETRNLASKNGATGGGTSWGFQSCRLAELPSLYRAVLEAPAATPATLLSYQDGQNPLKPEPNKPQLLLIAG